MKHIPLFKQTFLVLGLLLSSLSFGHTSFPKKVKCPIDGKKFTIHVTGSYTTTHTLNDFQKQGYIGNLYEITFQYKGMMETFLDIVYFSAVIYLYVDELVSYLIYYLNLLQVFKYFCSLLVK